MRGQPSPGIRSSITPRTVSSTPHPAAIPAAVASAARASGPPSKPTAIRRSAYCGRVLNPRGDRERTREFVQQLTRVPADRHSPSAVRRLEPTTSQMAERRGRPLDPRDERSCRASCVRRARASLELGRPSFRSDGVPGASPTLGHPSAGRARSPATSSPRRSLARSPSREGPHRGSPDEDRRRQRPAQAILRPHRGAGITLGLCGHDPIKARPTGRPIRLAPPRPRTLC